MRLTTYIGFVIYSLGVATEAFREIYSAACEFVAAKLVLAKYSQANRNKSFGIISRELYRHKNRPASVQNVSC